MKSVLANEDYADKLPWQDVIMDIMGPFTRTETGEQYILAYICTKLKVPMLEAYINQQAGYFSRACVKCMLRTRVVPDIIRTDRGSEMASRVNEEFLSICNVKHLLGAALIPRCQGLRERNHQVLIANQFVLTHSVCCAHPQ